jgi:hypothetical protein
MPLFGTLGVVSWKAVQGGDPWADAPGDERPQGYWLAVGVAVGSLVLFGLVGVAVIAPQPVGRFVMGCPSRASSVSTAARRLGATHVTDASYAPGSDGSWIAQFDAVIHGRVVHVRTIAEYHHHWYGDCYSPVGSAVT